MSVYESNDIAVVSSQCGRKTFDYQHRNLIRRFITSTGETEPFLDWMTHLPDGHSVWFYRSPDTPYNESTYLGFLWTQVQTHEKGSSVLRVHALYIYPRLTTSISQHITRTFEEILSSEARFRGIKEIGFYTRRNSTAFIRRLNRTAPAATPWELDSYVITRKI